MRNLLNSSRITFLFTEKNICNNKTIQDILMKYIYKAAISKDSVSLRAGIIHFIKTSKIKKIILDAKQRKKYGAELTQYLILFECDAWYFSINEEILDLEIGEGTFYWKDLLKL